MNLHHYDAAYIWSGCQETSIHGNKTIICLVTVMLSNKWNAKITTLVWCVYMYNMKTNLKEDWLHKPDYKNECYSTKDTSDRIYWHYSSGLELFVV